MTIEQVGPTRDITTKYGQRRIYSVKFKENENWADLIQKLELPAPTMGQQMEGQIEKNQYGYSFKKVQSGFPGAVRASGYSNRQIALQCATRFSKDSTSSLEAAETFLKWLEVQDTAPQAGTSQTGSDAPPANNYEDLGL